MVFNLGRRGAGGQRFRWPSGSSGPGMVAVRTGTPIGALAVVVAVVSAAFVVLAPAANAAVCTPDPVLCPQRIYVGASVDGLPGDPAVLDPFTEATGVSPSAAMYFTDFGGRVDSAALRRLSDSGRLPMMTWEPWNHTTPRPTRIHCRRSRPGSSMRT